MLSRWPTSKGGNDDESCGKRKGDGGASGVLLRPDMNIRDVKHIDWSRRRTIQSKKKKIEHSFSDVSQFRLGTRLREAGTETNAAKLKGIRADFVHLYGVQLHSKESTIADLKASLNEEKEGFQFRSIQRTVSSVESALESCNDAVRGTKTVVVVPSMDLDFKELSRMCSTIEYYEERPLYHLFLANDLSVRIIYLTSNLVDEKVVAYYLGLAQDDDSNDDRFSDARDKLARVFVVSVPSKDYIPLSDKILEDKKLICFLKGLVHRGNDASPVHSAGITGFTGSDSMDALSHELGIRLLEASGDHLHYGTKQGSRQIFSECEIPHPAGTPSLDDDDLLTCGDEHDEETASWARNHRYIRSVRSLAIGLSRQILVHDVRPRKWITKLNQGFSGKGNATIDLRKLQQDCQSNSSEVTEKRVLELAAQIEKELENNLKFEDPAMTWHGDGEHVGYQKQIERLGVIAEAFIEGEVPSSPSVQVVIEPNDDVEAGGRVSIVATHNQLLQGQTFKGCINPASEQYRSQLMDMGLRIGRYLAARGVVGHFSLDCMATKKSGTWDLQAVEINLRQGGTTHPHAIMALLCGGCICSDGVFRTNDDEVRTYVATDCHSIKPCTESHLIDAIECKTDPLASKIRWNGRERVGVVFHLFKFALTGRIGFTAIGRNLEESQRLFDATAEFLSHIE